MTAIEIQWIVCPKREIITFSFVLYFMRIGKENSSGLFVSKTSACKN
jgi:hypothetical protein